MLKFLVILMLCSRYCYRFRGYNFTNLLESQRCNVSNRIHFLPTWFLFHFNQNCEREHQKEKYIGHLKSKLNDEQQWTNCMILFWLLKLHYIHSLFIAFFQNSFFPKGTPKFMQVRKFSTYIHTRDAVIVRKTHMSHITKNF